MLAAEQRLRDAGYGDKYIFAPENDDSDEETVTTEAEVKCAPWNTTKAYQAATKGKCFLDQSGIADPSGCGLGFSFVKVVGSMLHMLLQCFTIVCPICFRCKRHKKRRKRSKSQNG